MSDGLEVTAVQYAGQVQDLVRKTLPKENPNEAERVKRILEEERKKVKEVYSSEKLEHKIYILA